MTEQPNDVQNATLAAEDPAESSHLATAIETILPTLEQFLQFAEPVRTVAQRATWSAQLLEPLPQQGAGAEAVLAMMRLSPRSSTISAISLCTLGLNRLHHHAGYRSGQSSRKLV